MTSPQIDAIKTVTMTVLRARIGSATDMAAAIVPSVRSTYDDLAGVLLPLIGEVGLSAITLRALYLAQREYPTVPGAVPETAGKPFDPVNSWLERVEHGVTIEAASALFSSLGRLLVTFIGEPLTMSILREAWPVGFADNVGSEETSA